MLIKKETNAIVNIELDCHEQSNLKNYSKGSVDHCTFRLTEGVYFVFCKANTEGLIQFNGQLLFVGQLENAIRQEQGYNGNLVIKYCCNNSQRIGTVLSANCLMQPMFFNKNTGYDYNKSVLSCYNVA